MITPTIPCKFVMIGTLAEPPKLSPNMQLAVCDAIIQICRKSKKGDITEAFPVTFWGDLAKRLEAEVSLGSLLHIEGILQRRERTSKAGQLYFTTDIVALNFMVLAESAPLKRGSPTSLQHPPAPDAWPGPQSAPPRQTQTVNQHYETAHNREPMPQRPMVQSHGFRNVDDIPF